MFFDYFSKYYIHLAFGPGYVLSQIIMIVSIALSFFSHRFSFKRGEKDGKNWFLWKKEGDKPNGIVSLYLLADLASVFAITIFCYCFFEFFLGSHNYINYLVWPIVVVSSAFLFNKDPWFAKVAKIACLVTFLFVEPVFGIEIKSLWSFRGADVLTLFLLSLLFVLVLRYCRLDKYPFSNMMSLILLVAIMAISIVSICLWDGGNEDELDTFNSHEFFVDLGYLLFSISSYYLYYRTLLEHDKSLESQAILFKVKNEEEMLKMSKNNMEELASIRHDLKNQYQYMKTLLESKDYDKLNTFFADMTETAFVPLSYVDTGNSTLTSILNIESEKARNNQITLSCEVVVPKTLRFSDYDLCSLLSNLIDNALEGTVAANKEKKVSLKIHYQKPNLFLYLENPTSLPDQEHFFPKGTTKRSGIHGYGSKIIAGIVHKYDGEITYTIKDGVFHVSCLLLEDNKENKESDHAGNNIQSRR